jgi:hypothetical protein
MGRVLDFAAVGATLAFHPVGRTPDEPPQTGSGGS